MAYRPGSFSKNFAWHGTGLRKLHGAIRRGFRGQLRPVERSTWRLRSGIDDSNLDLVPVNFFLHNTIRDGSNFVSIDELVLQAVSADHSTAFDRLALFALNLSQGGARIGPNTGEATSAPWANEFVRKRLWSNGAWQRSDLSHDSLDEFLREQLDAQPAVKVKVRNNYRHLFELCRYLPAAHDEIDGEAEAWGTSAAFLKWDRLILDGQLSPSANLDTLRREALNGELHKLLGTTVAKARQLVDVAAPLYIAIGRLNRIPNSAQQLQPLIKRIETGTQPRYGSPQELSERQAILDRITALERELERARPPHGGIGHNNPPPNEVIETEEVITTIKTELEKKEPDAVVVARSASRLHSLLKWLAKKADKAADKFVELGVVALAASSPYLWPYLDYIRGIFMMLVSWLRVIVGL